MARFPFVRQRDSMQCGIACLQMVCKHYKENFSYAKLSRLCTATAQGVSMLSISRSAQEIGLDALCVKPDIETLKKIPLPCILHWNQNHFVVLYDIRNGRNFRIADPSKGRISYREEEFRKHWISTTADGAERGIALVLQPTDRFHHSTHGDEDDDRDRHSFRFLWKYARGNSKGLCLILACLLVVSLMQLALPFLTQALVDVGIRGRDIGFVWLILAGQLMLTFSRTAVDFVRRWVLLKISMKINISLVSDFFAKLLRLPMSFFDTRLMGDLMQRMSDHGRVNIFLTQHVLGVAFSLLSFVVLSGVLFFYDVTISLVFLGGCLLYGLWLAVFLDRRKVIDYEMFELQAKNNNKTYELVTSMQEIKLQGCEQRRRTEWEDVQGGLLSLQMKSLRLQQTQEAGSIFINEMKNIVVTVLSATAVIHGDMTFGMMLAVQYIIGQMGSPVEQIMGFIYSLQDVRISLERINEIHHMDNEDNEQKFLTPNHEKQEGIHVSQVTFKYDPHSPLKALDDISIDIPHGKTTAIVGASGSGKTTLIKLLLGYYPPQTGTITVDGTNLEEMEKRSWRSRCGVVMQDGVIFSESIARNIAVADGDIDNDRMIQAAETACIKDYVLSRPLKFDTKIGRDGVGLSQGQRQRVLIARAIYKNPDYLFLDEATNSLDASNERAIVENLSAFCQGKTVVIVAHRLSTVRDADQIVVLDHGRVVETGTHESLTAKHGTYYNLVKNQLELGQ